MLAHLSHVCDLQVEDALLNIIDLRELFRGATTPRGLARIIVMDSNLQVIRDVEYINSRPLFCQENRLFTHGNVELGADAGNVLTFSYGGYQVTLDRIEPNDFPAPMTMEVQ